jgi:nucleotide-binding universal stress UspA family protein
MKILVAVDGSHQAALAASWVAQLPLTSADDVVVVAVAERPVLLGAWGYTLTPAAASSLDRQWTHVRGETHRAAEAGVAAFALTKCAVSAVVLEGHPIPVLIDLAASTGADVIVVGPHGHGSVESILLGSISQALLHAMPTSVLVAREPTRPPRRVLLATDGSPHSLAAARFLACLPLAADAQINVLVSVGGWLAKHVRNAAVEEPDLATFEGSRATGIIDATVAALAAGGRSGTPVIRLGDAKRAILAAARDLDIDLIVTGARGIGGFRGLLLGSVSRAVSKGAPCSTLVVADTCATPSNGDRR